MIKLRERDGYGLQSAGLEWREPSDWRALVFVALFFTGLAIGLYGIEMIKKSNWVQGGSLISFVICLGWAVYEFREEHEQRRSLIFYESGMMHAPLGLPSRYWPLAQFEITGHHEEIVSIEPIVDDSDDGQYKHHKVAIYFRSGSIVRVTNPVHKDRAHRIAVQLTAALHELRSARGHQAA